MVFFDKLTFSQITGVFEAFKEYYKPCEQEIKSRKKYYSIADVENIDSTVEESPIVPQIHYSLM